jgi:hypothetical protein
MLLSRAGFPASSGGVGALVRPAALLISLALGACSAAGPATQSVSWSPTQDTAGVPGPRVEIEGDGMEGQRPPRRHANETPDDPKEPFSPNYGSVPTYGAAPAAPGAPARSPA